jgi:N-acetylglucosaminyl-diphospho-decaprenol L-rhamnosyltransferase
VHRSLLASDQLDLTVTIVSWNTQDLLRMCLRSIEHGTAKSKVEVHVVDNHSVDQSGEMVRAEFPDVKLTVNEENVGFARANNQSWREARGRYWLLLNPDTVVRPGALERLVAFMDAHPRAGLATARLITPGGVPQHCAEAVPGILRTLLEASRLHKCLPPSLRGRVLLGTYWTYDRPIRLGWTWGTALIARREAVEEVGPLSEDFFMYGEDLEWCLRMRRRWEIWFCPEAEVLHHGAQSSRQKWDESGRLCRILDAVYGALEQHRGRPYVRALQVATLVALGLEWLASRVRSRTLPSLPVSLAYHRRVLKRAGSERTTREVVQTR